MTAASLGRRVLWCLEVVSLLALFGTGEAHLIFTAALAAGFALRLIGLRIHARWAMVTLITATVASGVVATAHYRYHPLISAAHVAIFVHALLWLGPDAVRDRVQRLAMSFIDIVIAAALSTDFYLFPTILLAFVLASSYVSIAFLESTFLEQYPDLAEVRIPRGFLKNMVVISMAIFVLSLALFPLLPRSSWRSGADDYDFAVVGFGKSVEITPSSSSVSLRKNYRPALFITGLRSDSTDPVSSLPRHLLRGGDLELFDGERWAPRLSKRAERHVILTGGEPEFGITAMPHVQNQLFLPYGSRVTGFFAERGHYGYVPDPRYRGPEKFEQPTELHTRLPGSIRAPELESLTRRLFRGTRTNADKAQALARFFADGFQASLQPQPKATDTRGVLANFVLRGKQGNCELFASAAALLLRMGGVPTRLVTGYRVLRSTDKGTLTVLDSDAHAWVEYWDESRWRILDPTPVLLSSESWLDHLRESYFTATLLWDQWVLNFGKSHMPAAHARQPQELSAKTGEAGAEQPQNAVLTGFGGTLGVLMAALALAGALFFTLPRFALFRRFEGNRELFREYLRMRRLLGGALAPKENLHLCDAFLRVRSRFGDEAAGAYRHWENEYLQLRFGA